MAWLDLAKLWSVTISDRLDSSQFPFLSFSLKMCVSLLTYFGTMLIFRNGFIILFPYFPFPTKTGYYRIRRGRLVSEAWIKPNEHWNILIIPPESISFVVLSISEQIFNMPTNSHFEFGVAFGNKTWKWISGQAHNDDSQKTEPVFKWVNFKWDPFQIISLLLSFALFLCVSRFHLTINHKKVKFMSVTECS